MIWKWILRFFYIIFVKLKRLYWWFYRRYLLLNIRISMYFKLGYRRPPFLVYHCKNEHFFRRLLFLRGYTKGVFAGERGRKRKISCQQNGENFCPWTGPSKLDPFFSRIILFIRGRNPKTVSSEDDNPTVLASDLHVENIFYLWPDSLRVDLWGYVLLWAIPLLVFNRVEYGFFISSFVWMIIILPSIVYVFCRKATLPCFWRGWIESKHAAWIKGIPALGKDSSFRDSKKDSAVWRWGLNLLRYSLCMFPAGANSLDSVYWMPNGSPQESFLRVALIDFFAIPNGNNKYSYRQERILRCGFYWFAPVWGGLLYVLGLMGYLFYLHSVSGESQVAVDGGLVLVLVSDVVLWLFYSVYFLHKESIRFDYWLKFKSDDVRYLPPFLKIQMLCTDEFVKYLADHSVRRLIAIVFSLAAAVMLVALAIFIAVISYEPRVFI